ncbi:MAG: helicase-related protein, partial [Mycobacteriales bacterium]
LQLGAAVERLGHPTVMALTATASPPVREEIVERLGLHDPVQVVKGFDRPGLRLTVAREDDDARRRESVVLRALSLPKPGLVYTATRRSAEDYAAALADLGADAAAYHAGLPAAERTRVQERFMAGELDVVVATSAFGMGIDKADVRFVLHAEVPDSLDSLYQEAGRAGRDGEPAEAVLLYRPEDLGLRRFFASGAVDPAELRRTAVLVQHAPGPVSATDLAAQQGISRPRATRLLELLEQAGAVRRDARGRVSSTGLEPERAAELAAEVDERHHRADLTRVDMVRAYAETQGCRRQLLLGYFGERLDELCGNCDTCLSGTARPAPDQDDSPYPLESTVRHAGWGRGRVMRFEEGRVVVLFEQEGYRTLSLDAVLAGGLLTLEEA